MTSSIETLRCFFISDTRSCTNCSGAEAPEVIPILLHLIIDSIGKGISFVNDMGEGILAGLIISLLYSNYNILLTIVDPINETMY